MVKHRALPLLVALLASTSALAQFAAPGPGPIPPTAASSANPSASVGLSAVNGTASTFMTSDSAPALSQAIIPTWTGPHTWSYAGTASTPGVTISGTPYTAGTATTNFPQLYVNTTGATGPTTFSTAGTMFGINAPSGFTGNFIDLYVNGGATQFRVTNTGAMTSGAITAGGKVQATAGGGLALGANSLFTSPTGGQIQMGAADVNSAPVAQTLSEQSAITGNNVAGASTWTFQSSRGTGSGTGADIIFQTPGTGAGATVQNSYLTAMTLKAGSAAVPGNTQVFGDADFSGTTTVTGVANHLFVGGLQSNPTLGATAEGAMFVNAAGGINLMGDGSSRDFTIINHSGSIACDVAQNTQTLECQGLTVLGTSYQSSAAPWHFTNASFVTDFTFGASMARLVNLTSTHALWSGTAPTIGTCGTGGTLSPNNGTAAFSATMGSSPTSTCTVNMPSGIANAKWVCDAVDNTTISTSVFFQRVVSTSTTLITITNYNSSAAATAFVASDVIDVKCSAQ